MKKDSDYFEGDNAQLIYIAKRLKDATRLEEIFDNAAIDYGVEPDEYYGGTIFRRMRVGAFFYVRPEFAEQAMALMREHNYKPMEPVEPMNSSEDLA